MRAYLVTPLLLATLVLACRNGDGDSSSSSTGPEPHCSEGWGDGPEVDPDYPPCGCDASMCDNGGKCRYSGDPIERTSSLCHPPCSNGPTCPDPNEACMDNNCPLLGDVKPACIQEICMLYCDPDPCPAGYVCGDGGACQVKLE